MSPPGAARAVAGDGYAPVNSRALLPLGAHTRSASSATCCKQLDTPLYIYLKK